jgi:hypothetical protein
VSLESWTLLLGRMLFSFFSSPYLLSTGDKLASAVSIAHMALQIVRDLANPLATALARPLPKAIWQVINPHSQHRIWDPITNGNVEGSRILYR